MHNDCQRRRRKKNSEIARRKAYDAISVRATFGYSARPYAMDYERKKQNRHPLNRNDDCTRLRYDCFGIFGRRCVFIRKSRRRIIKIIENVILE